VLKWWRHYISHWTEINLIVKKEKKNVLLRKILSFVNTTNRFQHCKIQKKKSSHILQSIIRTFINLCMQIVTVFIAFFNVKSSEVSSVGFITGNRLIFNSSNDNFPEHYWPNNFHNLSTIDIIEDTNRFLN
jgi:hypothetical protein